MACADIKTETKLGFFTVLTEEDVTPSVQQVDDRLAKTIKRDLDAPVLRENCAPYDFGEIFTEIRHGPATERYRIRIRIIFILPM